MFFTLAQKYITKFGNFLKKICNLDLSKIAQFGHTAREQQFLSYNKIGKPSLSTKIFGGDLLQEMQ